MSKQKAIIVDLDGTYCDHDHRRDLWIHHPRPVGDIQDAIPNDGTVEWCQRIINDYAKDGYKIIFLTARTYDFKEATEKWLQRVAAHVDYELQIRKESEPMSTLPDSVFKGVRLLTDILHRYDVKLAIDDKMSCCQVFRAHGIATLCCSNNF